MKRMSKLCVLAVAVLAGGMPVLVEAATKSSPLQLTVDLSDGSRLIGVTMLTSLPVRSEALGKLQIPLAKVRAVKFSRDHEAVNIAMVNGDQMKGGLGDLSLELRTCFGDVKVPVEHVTTITVCDEIDSAETFNPAKPYGLRFDGRQNYIAVPCAAVWLEKPLTVECWLRNPSSTNPQGACVSVGKQWTMRTTRYGVGWYGVTGAAVGWQVDHAIDLNDGAWHHVAGVWDGQQASLFVDGSLRGKQRYAGTLNNSQLPLTIGSAIPGIDLYLGDIAEVRVSKVDRYMGGNFTPARGFKVDADTVGYWKLNAGSGLIAHDTTGNEHDGRLVGQPAPQWINQDRQ